MYISDDFSSVLGYDNNKLANVVCCKGLADDFKNLAAIERIVVPSL